MKKFLFVLALAFAAAACEKNGLAPENSVDDGYVVALPHDEIVLGEKLDDPYTVANMTKAFSSLYPTKDASSAVSTTDLYVRFLPKDDGELQLLEDMGLALLDHPVDYEIVKEGDYYHDPSLPDEAITWQYGVVPADFKFPEGVKYELLDECYIAEHGVVTRATEGVDWAAVEEEAFRLTGNGEMASACRGGISTKASGTPSGRITIIDPQYSSTPIGVKGVQVSCNVFVKFAHAYTDADGNYTMGKTFSKNPRYRLIFKNQKGFGIGFNLIIIPASISTLGSGPASGVSCTISNQSNRALFCRSVVNNAVYDYFEQCASGEDPIVTPPSNLRIWLFQTMEKSCAVMLQHGVLIDGSPVEDLFGEFYWLFKMFLPDITLGLKGQNDYASIYGTAMHECAHASHYMKVGNSYWNKYAIYIIKSFVTSGGITYGTGTEDNHGYCEVGEMWAYYMQTRAYRNRYPDEAVTFGSTYWFHPQIFWYMDQRGINQYKIFKALTEDVNSKDVLKSKLLSMYPESKSVINGAFSRY